MGKVAAPRRSSRKPARTKSRRKSEAAVGTAAKPASETVKPWTFLTNHSHVLIVLYSEPGLVLREVANRVGITERAVQRIVQDLEEEGFLRREKVGRRNQYEVSLDKALRHPVESHRTIRALIDAVVE